MGFSEACLSLRVAGSGLGVVGVSLDVGCCEVSWAVSALVEGCWVSCGNEDDG